jgi:hypothetical protein
MFEKLPPLGKLLENEKRLNLQADLEETSSKFKKKETNFKNLYLIYLINFRIYTNVYTIQA